MAQLKADRVCPKCFNQLTEGLACPCCGYSIASAPEKKEALGWYSLLAQRYLVGCVLGAGGFGITYSAYDYQTDRRVAIKEYFRSKFCSRSTDGRTVVVEPNRRESYQRGMQEFFNEADRLRQFQDCPYVVEVYDCFKMNNTAYLVMEYVDGPTLGQLTQQYGGRLPLDKAEAILVEAALGLSMMHRNGLIHSDVAPDNIICRNGESVVLIDFGAARNTVYADNPDGFSIKLKSGYAPPEQYEKDGKVGAWTDIYALASTFYKVTTGISIPDAKEREKGIRTIQPYAELMPNVRRQLADAIDKALSLDARERQQNTDEFIHDITGGSTEPRLPDPPPPLPPSSPSPKQGPSSDEKPWKQAIAERMKKSFGEAMGWFKKLVSNDLDKPEMPNQDDGPKKPDPVPAPPKREKALATVRVLAGMNPGRLYQLPAGEEFIVGRQPTTCQLVIGCEQYISRTHCSLLFVPDAPIPTVRISDISKLGTYVKTKQVYLHHNSLDVTETVELCIANEEFRLLVSIER